MGKRLTTEEFIRRAREAHGDKYDYSKVEYITSDDKVCIICPIHGEFWQMPRDHAHSKSGCPRCNSSQKGRKLYGIGINDIERATQLFPKAYLLWKDVLRRCYDTKVSRKHPSYIGCSVSDDWKYFSCFKEWYDAHYVEGWHLDKDILIKGNKEYAPNKCCFVPQEINKLFTKRQFDRGIFPIGVVRHSRRKYYSAISVNGVVTSLGGFNTPEEAFNAYKVAKEAWIKEVADKWKDKLDPKVYKALYEYQVEITD